VDWEAFQAALVKLKEGKPATVPCYDYSTHCRFAKGRMLRPKALIVVDGLWVLRKSAIRRLFDLRVFVDCSTVERLRRRIARDCDARGRTVRSVREQFAKTVEPMHQRYVVPQAKWADMTCLNGATDEEIAAVIERIRVVLEGNQTQGAVKSTPKVSAGRGR